MVRPQPPVLNCRRQPVRKNLIRYAESNGTNKESVSSPSSWARWRRQSSGLTTLQGFCWMSCIILLHHQSPEVSAVSWEEWWTYEGISGPAFWGLINPEWSMCNRGRRQSPINIEPSLLLYDPNLRPLHIDKNAVSGYLTNMGQGLIFTVDNSSKPSVNLTGGPLSYKYEWHQMALHFGLSNSTGSEHTIAGRAFPAELQIFGFNTQLYSTYSEALDSPNGIVAISVLIQIGDAAIVASQSPEFSLFLEHATKIERIGMSSTTSKGKRGLLQPGQERSMPPFSLKGLLPQTEYYITYEGSATMPACQETATWILFNRPIYMTEQQLYALRGLKRGNPNQQMMKSPTMTTASDPMGNNYRPIQPTHHRPVRTNIDFTTTEKEKACATMHREMHYRANTFWQP